MATQKLNLTRDQLATFLKNHEQIKQFERLFALADEIAPASDTQGISIQAGNADAAATEALAQIVRLAQDSAINSGSADQKAVQALDTLALGCEVGARKAQCKQPVEHARGRIGHTACGQVRAAHGRCLVGASMRSGGSLKSPRSACAWPSASVL